MIAFVEMTVTFAALTALCLFLNTKMRLAAGLTPLFVLCGTMVWYSTLGSVHMLVPAGIVWFGAAAAACVWLWRKHKDIRWREFFSPAMVYFLLASLAVIVLFAVRRPIFNEWDEFSFWGIAPKVVKTENQLYTYNPGEMRVSTFVPGIIMLDYAFQFLGSVFVPWKVYAAYDILFFAVFAAAISMLGRRHWHIAVPAAAVLTLVPYMVSVYQRGIYVQTTYMNAYSDIPMGLLFGAGLVLYFAPRKKTPILMTGAVLAVTASCLSKDMGFALCLIAAAIICFDLLFVQKEDVPFFRLKGLGGKLCWCASLVGAPLAAFFGWAAHMSVVLGSNRFDIGGSADMGMVQMVTTGIAELLGIGRTQKFTDIMELMKSAFFNTRLTMFSVGAPDSTLGRIFNGSGFITVLLILSILLAAFLLGDKRMRVRTAWTALWSTLGFAAFYIFTGFTYVYVFKEELAYGLGDYNRYIYPYYAGWLVFAVTMLCASLKNAKPGSLGTLFLLALCGGCIWRADAYLQPQLTVLDYPDSHYAGRRLQVEQVEAAKHYLTRDDKVFIVSMTQQGVGWFQLYYEFYPDVAVDYSFGAGEEFSPDIVRRADAMPGFFTEEQVDYFTSQPFTPAVWCDYLEASGCTAIYMDEWDAAFAENYGALFADGLGTALAGFGGGCGTTTYAENIGVMAATRVYSTAAYWFAALFALLLSLCPKFGALINSIPVGVLGGACTLLYGMIGMLGVRIWVENHVDFSDNVNLMTAAIPMVVGIADFTFSAGNVAFNGIAIGSIACLVLYHGLKAIGKARGTLVEPGKATFAELEVPDAAIPAGNLSDADGRPDAQR